MVNNGPKDYQEFLQAIDAMGDTIAATVTAAVESKFNQILYGQRERISNLEIRVEQNSDDIRENTTDIKLLGKQMTQNAIQKTKSAKERLKFWGPVIGAIGATIVAIVQAIQGSSIGN